MPGFFVPFCGQVPRITKTLNQVVMKSSDVTSLPTLRLAEGDFDSIRALINSVSAGNPRMKTVLQPLSSELERAEVLPEEVIPDTVVRMGSTFQVKDVLSGEVDTYTLVYPDYADTEAGLISILVPIGMGVIGFAEGDAFFWKTPGGVRELKLLKVKPPVTRL